MDTIYAQVFSESPEKGSQSLRKFSNKSETRGKVSGDSFRDVESPEKGNQNSTSSKPQRNAEADTMVKKGMELNKNSEEENISSDKGLG